jgi:tyrosine-protein kinase
MSRVYEALKRAERQRTEGQARADSKPAIGNGIKLPEPPPEGSDAQLLITRAAVPEQDASNGRSEAVEPFVPTGSGPHLVVGQAQDIAAAEQFHLLSLSIRNWSADHGGRAFAITSALSGDGKSFVALNLAASLATVGSPVVLIDADLRAPTLHRALGLERKAGLADYLMYNDIDFGQCLHSTPIPNLVFVPAGRATDFPTELLARPRLHEFVRQLRQVAPDRYIIIDSPAAAAVPDPQILRQLADAILVVVAANRTPRGLVTRTIESAAGMNICGIALNRFEPPRSTLSYYPERYSQPRGSTLRNASK